MKVDRISIINKDDNEFSEDYQCDLCDKTNYPMLSWGCTHDDDYSLSGMYKRFKYQ